MPGAPAAYLAAYPGVVGRSRMRQVVRSRTGGRSTTQSNGARWGGVGWASAHPKTDALSAELRAGGGLVAYWMASGQSSCEPAVRLFA